MMRLVAAAIALVLATASSAPTVLGQTDTVGSPDGLVVDDGAAVASPATRFGLTSKQRIIGMSIEDRPIIAQRFGTLGGRRVLVIGVIHGNEDAGAQIVDALRTSPVPDGVELWLIESMNPDGQAAQDRHNANQVDLNRNFPHKWGPIGGPGNSQYAGTGPASEPETRSMVNFISELRPDIAIWYHQDANLIIPSTGRDGRVRARYADLTGLPLATCCGGGGIYTGIAATWARVELKRDSDAVPFIVELPGGVLNDRQVATHAAAVLTIASEG